MSVECEEFSFSNFHRNDQCDIETFDTIPNVWSMRGEGKGAVLRSPTGLTYRSRRNAFEEMLISGKYSDEEIEAMKGCLIHE